MLEGPLCLRSPQFVGRDLDRAEAVLLDASINHGWAFHLSTGSTKLKISGTCCSKGDVRFAIRSVAAQWCIDHLRLSSQYKASGLNSLTRRIGRIRTGRCALSRDLFSGIVTHETGTPTRCLRCLLGYFYPFRGCSI